MTINAALGRLASTMQQAAKPSVPGMPYQQGTSASWRYLDTKIAELGPSPAAAADGVLELNMPQVPDGQRWFIERLAPQCVIPPAGSGIGIQLTGYRSVIRPQSVLDATSRGAADVSDLHQPILIRASETALWVWTGCPVGTFAYLSIQYRIEVRN